MITLKTLNDSSEQEIFDQVVNHLRKQGTQSKSTKDVCAYRGKDGLMCAAGCLIGDDEYTPEMDDFGEGTDWNTLVYLGLVPNKHQNFIERLQNIHDGPVRNWESGFKYIALDCKLDYKGDI